MGISNIRNWHRYVISIIGIVLTILTAIVADPGVVPPDLHAIVVYAPLVILILGISLGGLPRFQLSTGPGAKPILSPPPTDSLPLTADILRSLPPTPIESVPAAPIRGPTTELVDGHEIQTAKRGVALGSGSPATRPPSPAQHTRPGDPT